MTLFRQVNGVKIQLTPQEELETREEWAREDMASQKAATDLAEQNRIKAENQLALMNLLGLSQEEFDLIKNG